jgi:ABC-type dipeptide/oligopeptide/nickel transport system permease component
MLKRIAWALLAFLLVATLAFYTVGGRPGVLLLFVKYVMHQQYAPTQEVRWQAGPDQPVATRRPPNVVLIVADDLGINMTSRITAEASQVAKCPPRTSTALPSRVLTFAMATRVTPPAHPPGQP